jgi:hypothetical protein
MYGPAVLGALVLSSSPAKLSSQASQPSKLSQARQASGWQFLVEGSTGRCHVLSS